MSKRHMWTIIHPNRSGEAVTSRTTLLIVESEDINTRKCQSDTCELSFTRSSNRRYTRTSAPTQEEVGKVVPLQDKGHGYVWQYWLHYLRKPCSGCSCCSSPATGGGLDSSCSARTSSSERWPETNLKLCYVKRVHMCIWLLIFFCLWRKSFPSCIFARTT